MDFPYPVRQSGVKRAHLVDAQLDGGLLLELYSRDGVGTMVSTDFYEGVDEELTHFRFEIKNMQNLPVLRRVRSQCRNLVPDVIQQAPSTKTLAPTMHDSESCFP